MSKKIKLCKRDEKLIASFNLKNDGSQYRVTNPFSGASEILDERAMRLYKHTLDSEREGNATEMHKAKNLFRKFHPNKYMTLLD